MTAVGDVVRHVIVMRSQENEKMTQSQFVSNNREIDQGRDLPREDLEAMYQRIKVRKYIGNSHERFAGIAALVRSLATSAHGECVYSSHPGQKRTKFVKNRTAYSMGSIVHCIRPDSRYWTQ